MQRTLLILLVAVILAGVVKASGGLKDSTIAEAVIKKLNARAPWAAINQNGTITEKNGSWRPTRRR